MTLSENDNTRWWLAPCDGCGCVCEFEKPFGQCVTVHCPRCGTHMMGDVSTQLHDRDVEW